MEKWEYQEVSEQEMVDALRRPDSFMYWGDNAEMFETWAYGPTIQHRDSDALQRSNAKAIKAALAEIDPSGEDYEIGESSHWAVGWCEVVTFRVRKDDGTPTNVTRYLSWVSSYLEEVYPVLDEEDYSNEEYEESCEFMASEYRRLGVTDDNVGDVMHWLSNSKENGYCDCRDGNWPDDSAVKDALRALGYPVEDDDDDGDED